MEKEKEWAKVVIITDLLMLGNAPWSRRTEDPRAILEAITRNSFASCSPRESYSSELPTVPREFAIRDVLPIDAIFGTYSPSNRRIKIYVSSIEKHLQTFRCSVEDLLYIVRLHEFAHALVHLGIRDERRNTVLYNYSSNACTDWRAFLQKRRVAFSTLSDPCHELIAQALTYAGICALEEPNKSRLLDVFDRVERRQPDEYKLSFRAKTHIHRTRWHVLLDVARGEAITPTYPSSDMRSGLEELICVSADDASSDDHASTEFSVSVDENVSESLKNALQSADSAQASDGSGLELLVDRFAGLKVEIFAREHPPPHFRVICGNESANYRINDCYQISGTLYRYYKTVRAWHLENRDRLIEMWNRHRPSDCPVGAFREP